MKEADIHTCDGRTIRGQITRSIDISPQEKENHVHVSIRGKEPLSYSWEDVRIKDIESIDILGNGEDEDEDSDDVFF